QRLQQGLRVAYVSDAGTPGVSDPGARLVAAVHSAGLRALPLPGASSITTALCVAGAVAHSTDSGGFLFAGFLPVKNAERATAVQQLASEPRCVVLLEAPHRIEDLAGALAVLGERPVTLARELTKQFEEISTHPAQDLARWLAGAPQRVKGEFVVLLHPLLAPPEDGADAQRVLRLLLGELPTKTAVKLAADITGAPRNALYAQALQIRQDEGPAD
ncbi:MAG: 16S rRNA (cytidine(1402)-2'-O)-methyltransferase, partial [Alicycliphilus sp.]|nr:16S rRNA (cytidine(1402)-2'-O)-methyltransferase [Alicycliphilus sp.]